MINEETIYEQRRTTLRSGSHAEYFKQFREQSLPELKAAGAEVLCLLQGLIGYPAEEVIQISRFPNWDTWAQSQSYSNLPGHELAEKEESKLLRSIVSRPEKHTPREDRKPVYGYRRFFIRPGDLADFVHCTEEGTWARVDAEGARALGLWATTPVTDPQEIVMLTGYDGPAHWEETRNAGPMPENFDPDLWEKAERLATRRRELIIKSWVCLMRAIEV